MDVRHCEECDSDMSRGDFYKHRAICKTCYKNQRQEYRMRQKDDASDADQPSECTDDLYVSRNPRIPGEVKVGRSQDPQARAASMSAAQNFHIEVVATFPGLGHLEKEVHRILAPQRVDAPGREWFSVSVAFAMAAVTEARRPA